MIEKLNKFYKIKREINYSKIICIYKIKYQFQGTIDFGVFSYFCKKIKTIF
jgi:hypothetical protein